jgi:hypothetical protein
MALMGARESSLNNALLVYKYGFGLGFCGFGIFFFTVAHPLASGVTTLGFIAIGSFFLTVARVKLEQGGIEYRRLLRWHPIAYSEVRDCGESWVFGYIRPHRYAFPWGNIYFARPNSSDSLFGLDREIIVSIRSKAGI